MTTSVSSMARRLCSPAASSRVRIARFSRLLLARQALLGGADIVQKRHAGYG
jgi:hypothetical protein